MTAEPDLDEVVIDGNGPAERPKSEWRAPFAVEGQPELQPRRLPRRRRALKRELGELVERLALREQQLERAEAELQRQYQHSLRQTQALQQQAQRLREETARREAAEVALRTKPAPAAGSDSDRGNVEARRLAVHARARSAIAELSGSSG